MKKFGAGLLAAALLLSGCQREAPAEGPALTDDIDYMPVVEATDLASAGITLAAAGSLAWFQNTFGQDPPRPGPKSPSRASSSLIGTPGC